MKKQQNLSSIFNNGVITKLRRCPSAVTPCTSSFSPSYSNSGNLKFLPSYSSIKNISKSKCDACLEIEYIIKKELKTQRHFIRDNQQLKIKSNKTFRTDILPKDKHIPMLDLFKNENNNLSSSQKSFIVKEVNLLNNYFIPLNMKKSKSKKGGTKNSFNSFFRKKSIDKVENNFENKTILSSPKSTAMFSPSSSIGNISKIISKKEGTLFSSLI